MMLRYLAIFGVIISCTAKGSALGHPTLEGFQRALIDTFNTKGQNIRRNLDVPDLKIMAYGEEVSISVDSDSLGPYIINSGDQDSPEHPLVISEDGLEVSMEGNMWKALALPSPIEITPSSQLDFDFYLEELIEIHAICFDDNLMQDSNNCFVTANTQEWDTQNNLSPKTNVGETRHYSIPMGEYFTGPVQYIAFGHDNDDLENRDNGSSKFSNIVISETFYNHWDINTVNTSIVEDGGPLIKLEFNISNRAYSTQVLQNDCETNFTGPVESGISLTNMPETASGQFIQYDSLIKINHTAFISNDTYWTNISDTLGFMEICVLTELYLDEEEPKETVNFLTNLINITYDTDGNFEVLDIDVTRTGPEESEVAVDYSTYLEAYQCTPEDLTQKNTQTYSQGSVLVVCVKGDGDIVAVETIKQLSVNQGSNLPFEYISDTNGYNAAIVKTDCPVVDSNPICYAQLRLLGRFFSSNNPDNLRVTGSVTMAFPSNGERRLLRPTFALGQHNSRYLQDVSDSGAFNVEVELEQIEDSMKTQSILSGNTKYYLSSLAFSYVFGLVWYIV